MSADPVSGLTRRASSDLVNRLATTDGPIRYFDFQVKNGSKYILSLHSGLAHVYDLNGIPQTVTNSGAASYIDPSRMRFGVMDNDVYVSNNTIAPRMSGDVVKYMNTDVPSAIISVLGGAYGRTYSVTINGQNVASYITPDGSQPGHAVEASPFFIMAKLSEGLSANPNIYVGTDGNNNIFVRRVDLGPISIVGNDSAGGVNMKACTDYVTRVEDLPVRAFHNYAVRVASKSDPDVDVWYRFVANNPGFFFSDGFWQECNAPNIPYRLDKGSMPHVLRYNADDSSFSFGPIDWKDRQTGTLVSNPDPSFIGNPITGIAAFASRLVFLAGPNLIMSRTNRPTDFWIASAQAVADTDPIDIGSTSVNGALLSAVAHSKDLVVFTERGQFIVYGRTAITPKNANMVLTTSFEADLTATPVPAGRNVFFCTGYGRYAGVREFYTEGATDINDSRPITQHVKEYIKGKAQHIAASSNYEILLVRAAADPKDLYVYQYIWADNEKVQSAWSTWRLPFVNEYMFFDEELIYIVGRVGSNLYLYRLSLDQIDSEGVGFPVYLDSRFDVLDVHKSFALPYDDLEAFPLNMVQGVGCPNPGMEAKLSSKLYVPGTGWVYTLATDIQGGNLVVGVPYQSQFVPSPPIVKDQSGVPLGTAKLRIRDYIVSLAKSAFVRAMVRTPWGNSDEIKFDGRIVGEVANRVGKVALSDERFFIPVREEATNAEVAIYTDSPYPMTLLDLEWVGQYNKKGRRIDTGGK